MRVFKYRGGEFDRDLNSLSENTFWAPTRDALNDPCEGLFTQDNIDIQFNFINRVLVRENKESDAAFQAVKNSLDEVYKFVDKSGVYSLSETPLEELLWAHYGCSHTGFCVEYDLDKLIEYEKHDYQIINVKYKNSPQSVNVSDISKPDRLIAKMLGIKSKVWKYEKEIRVVTSIAGANSYDYRAVKAIYLGLRISDADKNRLMEALKGRGIKYFQIKLKSSSYKFSFTEIEDCFAGCNAYKYSIAPILEHAISPDYVNEKYAQYVSYLYKAAEIVRREPYCNEVQMVEFSPDKSDVSNPVIFVQYKRKENRYINHYLSLKEIDEQYVLIKDLDIEAI
ncbi:DUF2971 domain-containing protein [Psychromonas hadalis]|uniref:DUF2971 domain-containing protein n=1 Tax=Psychromonas hadalis TaxID=211669 RepID=UPI0003B5FE16|nr:DUF2971 domain-containing protein [Psychromonas hadalis]